MLRSVMLSIKLRGEGEGWEVVGGPQGIYFSGEEEQKEAVEVEVEM